MKIGRIIFFLMVLITLTACVTEKPVDDPLESIKIIGESIVDINEEVQFSIETTPSKLDVEVTWESLATNIATVSEDGIVKGLKEGTVEIKATSKENLEIYDLVIITIQEAQIESIDLIGDTTVYVGSNLKLQASINPAHANQEVVFTSSNPEVASVNEEGLVHGIKLGNVTITATSIINPTIKKEINITVENMAINSATIDGPSSIELEDPTQYRALFNNIDFTSEFNWTTSNPLIATVENGLVTPIAEGEVKIMITNISNPDVKAELTINVIMPAYKYYQTKVLLINRNNKNIELEDCPATTYQSTTKVLIKNGEDITLGNIDDLYVGMENVYVEVDRVTNVITQFLIDGKTGFANIRVAIRKTINDISDNSTLYHDQVTFNLNELTKIKTYDNSLNLEVPASSIITISIINNKMVVKKGVEVILESEKRIIFESTALDDGINLSSITRGSSELYSGNMEVAIVDGRLLVINDVDIEKYLYKVVPSEMPASYNVEALKAQAIAARTYTFRDIFSRTYENLGYAVDDSTMSQVYNNINPQATTTQAVNSTKGLVMMSNGELVSAFYYSTSSGLTASAHEVWIDNGFNYPEPIPYLIGQNLTKDNNGNPVSFDYTSEANMLAFFKNTTISAPDDNISYYRWNISFTKAQLATTFNINLKLRYSSNPSLILTQTVDGWKSLPIPENIGQVNHIYVNERGESGVVMSLVVEATAGTYKIVNQYNIRFSIRPKDAGVNNNSILFSGFFAIEQNGDSYTFYGGGNGHGVGMSQNGANTLGKQGYTYQEILSTYYKDTNYISFTYHYVDLETFKDYFK